MSHAKRVEPIRAASTLDDLDPLLQISCRIRALERQREAAEYRQLNAERSELAYLESEMENADGRVSGFFETMRPRYRPAR